MNWRRGKSSVRRSSSVKDLKPLKPACSSPASRLAIVSVTARLYLAVGLGSMIGGTGRWLASDMIHGWLGSGFPWGTLFVNVTGSFLIGFYAALAGPDGRLFAGPIQRQFVMTGICGGYTTFSIFSLESIRLLGAGRFDLGGLYVGVSVIGWLVTVWAGFALATRINRLRRN
jgi:fluoride exporter